MRSALLSWPKQQSPRAALRSGICKASIGRRNRFVKKKAKAPFNPKKFLAKVGGGKTILNYLKNQIVFSQGDVADAVFYIQQGNIKLIVVSEQGKEAVVAILGPGHFFGEGRLNGHPLRIATARAVDQCVITRLDKTTMTPRFTTNRNFLNCSCPIY